MSHPSDEPAEPAPETATPPEPKAPQWSLISLIDHDGIEPPTRLSEAEALATWSAVSAVWHPLLLSRAGELPRIEPITSPSPPGPREVRVVAAGMIDRLPSGYQTQAEDAGTILIEAGTDRQGLAEKIAARIDPESPVDKPGEGAADLARVARDFLALGTARWFLRDLTIAMGHSDGLDVESLAREVLAGAHTWRDGDHAAATNRLRAAFELLTQARERFYPVDAYIVDICLVDPSTPADALSDALEARTPVTFLAPAQAIENVARGNPTMIPAICEAITEGWADVVGGTYTEADEPLLPLESVLWQFAKAREVYSRHLDERHVETLARRRFALYPQLPQVAKRFGFRFAMHMAFDAGRFPIRPEAKRLWESPDGTSLETLTRPPLAGDRAAQGVQLPWRLASTMKDDHVATLPLVHWPSPVAPWYVDLRRVASYSPVLARWVTLNDYFHLTDRPFETFRPEPDEYVTPYLAQAVARRDERPVSRRAAHARLRSRLNGVGAAWAMAKAVSPTGEAESLPLTELEGGLESGGLEHVEAELARLEPEVAAGTARAIGSSDAGGRPGYLVLNPHGVARRAAVLLPDAALDLRPEGPLRASQFTDEGVWAIVDVPAFGYAWVPKETDLSLPAPSTSPLSARGRVLRNESMVVEIDQSTGGVRGVMSAGEETARLGQQLVVSGLRGADGKEVASRMRGDSFEVEYGGPALIQAISRGTLVDPANDRRLAAYRQRYRIWSGRPHLEIETTLDAIDPEWLASIAQADPWIHYLACRWAWPDPNSMLRRTCFLSPEITDAERPETPDALDISTRRQRTALLFGGLAHHQRHGTRMLDTILVAGRETERRFQVGVTLDLENPYQAALDAVAPALVVPTESGPPRTGPTGWLFQIDNRSVAVTRLEYADTSGEGRGWGVVFHLLETTGRPTRCRLRTFRNPTWARQTDFHHELVLDLQLDDDAVLIDLTPHEMARIEVTLG